MYYVIPDKVEDLIHHRTKTEIARKLELTIPTVINILNGKKGTTRTTALAFVYLRGIGNINDYFEKR